MEVPRVRQPGFVLLQESRLFEVDFAVRRSVSFQALLLARLTVAAVYRLCLQLYLIGSLIRWQQETCFSKLYVTSIHLDANV